MFFAITASIFAAGGGPVIVFGLYWKRGTTAGAWGAMITGALISITAVIIRQINPDFWINEVWFGFIATMAAVGVYVSISLFGKRQIFNLDKMLHRGKYQIKGEHNIVDAALSRGWKIMAIGKEFTFGDKVIYIGSYLWIFAWLFVFIIGTIYYFVNGIPDEGWMKFWYIYLIIYTVVSIIVIFWFATGGIIDLKNMFHRLKTMTKDASDNGTVIKEEDDFIK